MGKKYINPITRYMNVKTNDGKGVAGLILDMKDPIKNARMTNKPIKMKPAIARNLVQLPISFS